VRRQILVFHFSPLIALAVNLFESLGVEASERIVLYAVTDLDWVAANFTVFDVGLTANRWVENHRNLFPAIRATEGVFHQDGMLQQVFMALFEKVVSDYASPVTQHRELAKSTQDDVS
jgi:hypothetical protein